MIPVDAEQVIQTFGSTSVAKVTTSLKNIPFLINAVTDRIYKDKKLAIVREYSTNAWDEHIRANVPVDQIEITLPTIDVPTFRVRDFGFGLTQDQIRDVYCILGESSKRGSNDFNGQLGLGCKSGFGYGDSFIVTSWVNGEKSVYNIIKGDDQKEGDVLLMNRVPMQADERNGVEVSIPIKMEDISELHEKASNFYKYWPVLPTIQNMDSYHLSSMNDFRNEKPFLQGSNWELRSRKSEYRTDQSVAVMGQVAYPIDWRMFSSKLAMTPNNRIWLDIFQSNQVILHFKIGELKFTINREELEYTETTFQNLESRFLEIFSSIEAIIQEKFSTCNSIWEAKQLYMALFGPGLEKMLSEENPEINTWIASISLGGDFNRLEKVFSNRLVWNNIKINSGSFPKMDKWDLERPDDMLADDQEALKPCLITFKKQNRRVKKLRCSNKAHNTILPLNSVKVVILDKRTATMAQNIARYFLLSENTKVHRVHILRFDSKDQQERFFNYYNFHTAEYVNASNIVEQVKKWALEYRKINNKSSDESDRRVVKMRYIDVDTARVHDDEDVSLSELEEGGVFVTTSYAKVYFNNIERDHKSLARALKSLKNICDIDLDRVYLVTQAKQNAKWFQEAKANDIWMELGAYLKDNVDIEFSQKMVEHYHLDMFFQSNRYYGVNIDWINAFLENLPPDSDFEIFRETISNYRSGDKHNISTYKEVFESLGLTLPEIPAIEIDYRKKMKAIFVRYPLLAHLPICGYNDVDKNLLKKAIEYINIINEKEAFQEDLTKTLEVV